MWSLQVDLRHTLDGLKRLLQGMLLPREQEALLRADNGRM